jgi:outer membrane protein TolC
MNNKFRSRRYIWNTFALILSAGLAQGELKSNGIPQNNIASDSNDQVQAELQARDQIEPSQALGLSMDIQASVIDLLFARNREIRAVEKAAQAARERVKTFGVLPDPKFESSLFAAPIETRNGPMEGQFMLGQKFPLWGKLRREKQVAKEKAEIAALQLQQKKIIVVFQMRKAWESYLKIHNSLDILRNYRKELESFKSIALTQYSTGTGFTQHPILKLQIEVALVESQINTLQSSFESTINNLQSLFDGSFSPELFGNQRTILLPSKPAEIWLDQAKQVNPLYQIAQGERRITVLENELAARKNSPDLVAGITYTSIGDTELAGAPAPGDDAFGVKIGLNIPLWFGRNKARVQATKLMIGSREENLEAVWNRIEDAVSSTKKDLDELEETYTLYKEQLQKESDQMLSSAFAAYETGKISFLDLLDSERMVVRVELEFEAVEARRRSASGRLLKDIGIINWDGD